MIQDPVEKQQENELKFLQQEVTVTLKLHEVNSLINALAELPFKISDPLIRKIHGQVGPQVTKEPPLIDKIVPDSPKAN